MNVNSLADDGTKNTLANYAIKHGVIPDSEHLKIWLENLDVIDAIRILNQGALQ